MKEQYQKKIEHHIVFFIIFCLQIQMVKSCQQYVKWLLTYYRRKLIYVKRKEFFKFKVASGAALMAIFVDLLTLEKIEINYCVAHI